MRPHLTTRAIPLSPYDCCKRGFLSSDATTHQQPVNQKTEPERDEPGVGIELIEEVRVRNSPPGCDSGTHKPGHNRKNRKYERHHRSRIHPTPVAVAPIHAEQIIYIEALLPQ